MDNSSERPGERLFSLKEIIRLTGHEKTQSAYSMLRNHGKKPDSYRRAARAPEAVWRTSVVKEVFARHLARAARLRGVKVDDLFRDR